MLVSVTVNSVNKFSSFITAYLPGCLSKVKKCNIKTKANVTSVSQRKRLLRRICSQDSYCIGFYLSADGVSLALRIAFAPARKPYGITPDESVEDEILPMIPLNTGLT